MVYFKNNKYGLKVKEYKALQEITRINKMDCWFSIRESKDNLYYIYDLEDKKRISLKAAIKYIYEGLLKEDFEELEKEEQNELNNMFKIYGLKED